MQIATIGIDIGKSSFHVVGLDARGEIVVRRRCSRTQLMRDLANLPPCLVGMEACCGAHHLGRRLVTLGHTVRLIPPQFVKPFVKSQKNDLLDAEAIAEAVQRPTMRFVPLKTTDQLDLQALHRVRTRLVRRRTAVINQLRAFCLERGVTFPVGRRVLIDRFPEVLRNPAFGLSPRMCRLLQQLRDEWRVLDQAIQEADHEVSTLAHEDEACRRLTQVPGIGPLTARLWWRPSAMARRLPRDATLRRGSAWWRSNIRPVVGSGSAASPSAAIPISATSLFMERARSVAITVAGHTAWAGGSRVSKPGRIRTLSSSPSPIHWHGPRGPFSNGKSLTTGDSS
jgi:transposase